MAKHKQPHLIIFLIAIIVIFILFGLATFFLTNRRPGQQREDFWDRSERRESGNEPRGGRDTVSERDRYEQELRAERERDREARPPMRRESRNEPRGGRDTERRESRNEPRGGRDTVSEREIYEQKLRAERDREPARRE